MAIRFSKYRRHGLSRGWWKLSWIRSRRNKRRRLSGVRRWRRNEDHVCLCGLGRIRLGSSLLVILLLVRVRRLQVRIRRWRNEDHRIGRRRLGGISCRGCCEGL